MVSREAVSARARRTWVPVSLLALSIGAAACGTTASVLGSARPSARFPTSAGPTPSTASAVASYTPWPESGHDPQHSGSSPALGPKTGAIEWMQELGAGITSGPVVESDGTIVIATDAGILRGLNPVTGADVWTYDSGTAYGPNDLSTSPAILPDGIILWPGPQRTLFALDGAGHELWARPFPATVLSPVVASSDNVYVVDVNGGLSSLIVGRGGSLVKWSLALGGGAGSTFGSPAIERDGTIITTVGHEVVAVVDHGNTGRVVWRYNLGAAIEVSPAIGPDGTVVVGANNPYQYGLSPTGKLRWKVRRRSETYSSTSVTHDGLAYYGDNNGEVYGVRAATGVPIVRYQGVHGVWSIPVIDGGHCVYFGTQGGHIYGFTYQGRKLFDINAHGPIDSYPAITGDGTLVIGTEKGVLYAIRGSGSPKSGASG